ncbi:hypothetical protein Tco_0781328 [Tanacetum coccineum]
MEMAEYDEILVDPHGFKGYLKMEVELTNLKKDATLKFFKSTNHERYEHVGPEVTSHKSTRWQNYKMAKRLCLVDDLKLLKITISNTSSRNKLNPEVNDHYNIFTRESQEYELKTKDEAYAFVFPCMSCLKYWCCYRHIVKASVCGIQSYHPVMQSTGTSDLDKSCCIIGTLNSCCHPDAYVIGVSPLSDKHVLKEWCIEIKRRVVVDEVHWNGPHHTKLPTPDEIHRFLQLEHIESNHTIKSKNVILTPNQILTKELRQDIKRWEELIRENVFRLGGHQDHLPACLTHMLYYIVAEEQYNLAYFFAKRIEWASATPTTNLLYGMFLTRLFRYVMEHYPYLDNSIYNVVDRVMRPLALKQNQKPRSDHGMPKARHSV